MNSILGLNFSETESDKIDLFLTKLEEIKKFLKLFKIFLIDFSSSGDLYGKSISKTLKAYSNSFQTLQNDPTSLNVVINDFLNVQESVGKNMIIVFSDYPLLINQKIDEYYEKLNTNKKRILDLSGISFKNFVTSKSIFIKNKFKYEKNCKEADTSINSQRKVLADPNTMYNQQFVLKIEQKTKGIIKEALISETNLKNSSEEAAKKLEKWNKCLIESFQIINNSYKGNFEKMFEILDKYFYNYEVFSNASIKTLKEKNNSIQNNLMLINEEKENLFLEDMKSDLNSKGLYQELHAKMLGNSNVKDNEVQIYVELAQKHLETFIVLIDERRKIYKSLKHLLSEISGHNDVFSKNLIKNLKNNLIISLGNSPFVKKLQNLLELFYISYENLSKKISNFSLFLNIKVTALENILKEHKAYEKNLSTTITKTLKEIFNMKLNLAKGIQNYEKLMTNINETEKIKNETKLNQLKKDTEDSFESNKEIMSNLKKMASEAAVTFSKAYREFRNHEQLNLQSIKLIVEGINTSFSVALEEIFDSVKQSSEFWHKKFDIETDIKSLISSDEKLSIYIDKEIIEEDDFSYEKLFNVPNDIKIEEGENLKDSQINNIIRNSSKKESEVNSQINNSSDEEIKSNEVTETSKACEGLHEEIKNELKNEISSPIDRDSAKLKSIKFEEIDKITDSVVAQRKISNNFSEKIGSPNQNLNNNDSLIKENSFNNKNENLKLKEKETKEKEKETEAEEINVRQKFNLNNDDKFISSFSCAFAQKILLQGRLYVFNTRICFHSYFNSKTLFGNTLLNIPKEDIIKLEKRLNAKIFDNAIAFITKNGELFFASFMYRDQAFDLLNKIYFNIIPKTDSPETASSKVEDPNYFSDINKKSNDFEKKIDNSDILAQQKLVPELHSDQEKSKFSPRKLSKKKSNDFTKLLSVVPSVPSLVRLNERKSRIYPKLIPDKNYKQKMNYFFENTNAKDFFYAIFSDPDESRQIKNKGISYKSFIEYFLKEEKDEEIIIKTWSPSPPKYYNELENFDYDELIEYPDFSVREVSYMHPIREKVMFAPKASCCLEKIKVYWIDHNEFIVESETHFSKIPFGDYFILRKTFVVQENVEKKGVNFEFKFYVDFVKSTIFQSRIDKSTTEENKEVFNELLIPCIQKVTKDFNNKIKDTYGIDSLNGRIKPKKSIRKSVLIKEENINLNSSSHIKEGKLEKLTEEINDLKSMIADLIENEKKKFNSLNENIDSFKKIFFGILIILLFIAICNVSSFFHK